MNAIDLCDDLKRHLRLASANTDPKVAKVLQERMATLLATISAEVAKRACEKSEGILDSRAA